MEESSNKERKKKDKKTDMRLQNMGAKTVGKAKAKMNKGKYGKRIRH